MLADGTSGGDSGKLHKALFGVVRRLVKAPPVTITPSPNGDLVRDDSSADGSEAFTPMELGRERRLPDGMAELFVSRVANWDGSGPRFELFGACCCSQTQPLGVHGKPRLDFDTLIDQGTLPADILSRLREWSRKKRELTVWLDERRKRPGTRHELVIWDNTAYRIPWELFWVVPDPASARSMGHLGALLTVTRWLTVETAWTHGLQPYTKSWAQRETGSVVAYIDPAMSRDTALLRGFDVEVAESMENLLARLRTGAAPLALVYVACHGAFGDSLTDWWLGGLSHARASDLADRRFSRLKDRPALVFLNACHSGSIDRDNGTYNDEALRGFAEVFLRAGAGGVLATTGRIGDQLAHEAARDLFGYLRQHPATPVAEAIRALRERAMSRLSPDLARTDIPMAERAAANRELLPVLYWFMYAYYGSPRMVISPAGGQGPGSRAAPS